MTNQPEDTGEIGNEILIYHLKVTKLLASETAFVVSELSHDQNVKFLEKLKVLFRQLEYEFGYDQSTGGLEDFIDNMEKEANGLNTDK